MTYWKTMPQSNLYSMTPFLQVVVYTRICVYVSIEKQEQMPLQTSGNGDEVRQNKMKLILFFKIFVLLSIHLTYHQGVP